MKIRKFIIAGSFGLVLLAGCGSGEKQESSIQKVSVQIDEARIGNIVVSKTFSGTLEGARQSKIFASIPERVVSLPVSEGKYVKAGQPIIMLDKSGSASQYNQARAVYLNAQENFEKMKNLYEQKAISEMSYKGARTSYEVAEANFTAAKAAVELSVPINGIVTDIAVNVGDQVPLGVPIATVANIDKMRLVIFVGSDEVGKMHVGQGAKVLINSDNPMAGKIIEVSKSADPDTRLFRVELGITNADRYLKPGMFARAEVVIDEIDSVLTVSNRSLFSEEGIFKVYIIQNDTAYVKSIETGATDGTRTQVVSGLEEGAQVVTVGKSSLRDGTPVMMPEAKDSADVSG
jgi:membrane fusion protein (multidrug efflux system)